MKKKLILPIISFIGLSASAQVLNVYPNIDWVRNYSEKAAISNVPSAIDAGSNVYVTGYTYPSSPSNADLTTIKYDATGILMWVRHYDNGGYDDANAITLDSPGNIYVTGESAGVGTSKDIITIKYDAAGTQLWASRYNGAINGNDVANAIITDPSGNVYVTGKTDVMGGTTNYITIKYNSAGVQQWVHTYNGTGNNADASVAIDFSSTNRLFITGTSQNLAGNSDIVTIRINPNTGAQMWVKTINGTANANDIAFSLLADGNDVVVVGSQKNNVTGDDYVTLKYNGNTGTTLWQKNYDNSNQINVATSLVKDASNNYVVTGTHYNGALYEYHTIMYNNTGVQQWVNVNATNIAFSSVTPKIAVDPIANHFYVCGEKKTVNNDILVYQITPGGNKTWEETFNGAMNGQDAAVDLVVNTSGIVYVAGASLNSSAKFDYTTIRISQTPYYNVPDLLNEPTSRSFSYYTNSGQIKDETGTSAKDVLFYSHNQNPEVFVEKNAYNYVFQSIDTSSVTLDTIEKIKVTFLNGNRFSKSYSNTSKTYPINYFLGHVGYPITDVVGYDRLFTPNIYPNIDLHYFSNAKGLKYYFVVKPGADVNNIKLVINGASSTFINSSNNLVLNGVLGDVELKQPLAYQVNMLGAPVALIGASTFTNVGTNVYGVKPTTYNPSLPLIIVFANAAVPASPSGSTANMEYSTYYGKTNNDIFNDIRVAPNGDRYVVGNTDGGTFPTLNGIFPYSAGRDAVLLKYSVIKDSLAFATFYGGGSEEFGNSVDVTSTGLIFIGGQTFSSGSGGIPIVPIAGASNQILNGMSVAPSGASPGDGFIAEFGPNGNVLFWSRYYGGSQDDGINSIYIDNANNLHFTGFARSNNITMVNAAQAAFSTGTAATNIDAIVGKFNSSNVLDYSTYLGGGNSVFSVTKDIGRDITVDGSGNAIVVGWTDAFNFPVNNATGNPNTFFDNSLGGARDGFIARYSPTGVKQFASYFGGAGTFGIDEINCVNYNATKNEIYFAGQSNDSLAFPYLVLPGAFNLKQKAPNSAFIASMSGNLTKQWCTSYGKAASNFSVTGLASDNAGIIYLAGQAKTNTLNYPVTFSTLNVYNDTIRNLDDGFVTIFNPQKDLFHAFYLGGSGDDYINNAYVGTNNKLYVVGNTGSTNYPIAYNSINILNIDSTFGGGLGQNDGFITRFDMNQIQVISVKENSNSDFVFNAYPNPSTNGFVLDLKNNDLKNVEAKIYNLTGQVIAEQKITQPLTQFNCESWASGIYLVNINTNGKLKTFKLIKN